MVQTSSTCTYVHVRGALQTVYESEWTAAAILIVVPSSLLYCFGFSLSQLLPPLHWAFYAALIWYVVTVTVGLATLFVLAAASVVVIT
jgi:hypothetical protein